MSGNNDKLQTRTADAPVAIDVYKRSQAKIRRLKEKLPEDLVANLAREVIMRVASKDRMLDHVPYEANPEALEKLCVALLSDDDKAASGIISELRADGVRAEDIYLKQLAAAARILGDKWVNDELSFSQVTGATGRMYAIMRSLRHLFEPKLPLHGKAAVFAAVPGEDHTLGVHMAADFFRKDGWDIALKVGMDHDELVAEIGKTPVGILGLSVSGKHSIEALSRLVVALNICSPSLIILVGGSNVSELRPILDLLGLDIIAPSIEDAKMQMTTLYEAQATA